jgi:RecA-family ATPase
VDDRDYGQDFWPPELWMGPNVLKERASNAPEQVSLLGPIRQGQVGWIAAPPGVGKSMFALSMAMQISLGEGMGIWGGCNELKLARLIDAELTDKSLYERTRYLLPADTIPAMQFNTWGLRESLGADGFSLGDPEHQLWLMQTAANSDVVIVDNISFTLDPAPGGNMYSPETINQVRPLLSWAHSHNKLLIFIDHTNAEGNLAGSLQKQRMADWVMLLAADECDEGDSLAFTLKWDKYRDADGPRINSEESWRLKTTGKWEHKLLPSLTDQIRDMLNSGGTPKEVSQDLGCHLSQVYRVKKSRA